MTRFLSLAAALVVGTVALSGCDSSRSNSAIEDLDGRYSISELIFDPVTASLPDANIAARLRASGTSLQIFGGDGSALLQSQFDGSGSRRTDMSATATRGSVTFVADTADDERELADLFLPRQFSMTYEPGGPQTLVGAISLSSVNLQAFDPTVYNGLPPISGTLRIRMDRITN